MPAWTIRLWKIYSFKCNGRIFKTDIRRNQNRKSDCSETFHEICHHFQNYGLLPWRTVQKNVELGLETKNYSKEKKANIASHYLKMVGLEHAAKKRPAQLSGGMQQRVAIARALAVEPDILFMDEPFGALDAITRMKLQTDILEIAQDTKKTVVFVTHDIEEAVFLADRIVIMSANPGRIKALLTVQLPKHRDRTSNDFLMIRDKVYEIFNMKSHETIEYYI